jgi:hypothetical protein
LTFRRHKSNRAVIQHLDYDVTFVHLPVMETTETHEVGELGLAAVRPMFDVMTVEIARVWATWESTAAAITRLERTL